MSGEYDFTGVPTLRQFAKSNAFIRGVIGPVGSGKSSASVVEIARRGRMQAPGPDGIRRTRWVVVRQTIPQLLDTTIRTFFQWFPPEHYGHWHATDRSYEIKAFEGCHIEILFRPLDEPDDIRKLLSLDLTGGWINEAREVPWPIVDALQGRLGRYPPKNMGGPTWFGMWLDTNPPDTDSRWYRFFEEEGWRPSFDALVKDGVLPANSRPEDFVQCFRQPSGLSSAAENLSNLPDAYYQRLAIGKTDEWVKVYIHGRYGFVSDNKTVFPEFNEQMHVKDVDPIAGRTIYRSWDWGLCYDDKTEVLTERGWKFFENVDCDTDRVATRDPVTGAMSYARPAFKVAKPYKGEMMEWSSTELNICVTPEHRVPFTYRDSPKKVHWQSAEWLAQHMTGHHYVDLCSDWHGAPAPSPHWLDKGDGYGLEEPTVFAAFMGLYLSEGSTNRGMITIYQREPRADMQAILDATGLAWKWRAKNSKTTSWQTWHPALAVYLRQFGRAKEKFVPFHVKQMPPGPIKAFLSAYTAGDGHVRTRKNGSVEHTIFTASPRMAGDMQELAQKAGWNSSSKWEPPSKFGGVIAGRKVNGTGGWRVTFKKTATRAELLKRNFRRVAYDGIVYCLNVPHHTLYVRRQGRPSWNGNTPACVFSQILPDGRWLVFGELVSEDMSVDRFSDEVLEHCSRSFEGHTDFEDIGDPAGAKRAETDARTCFEILEAKGIDIQPGLQSIAIRLESVRKPLRTIVGAGPQFILHPRCKVLRKGFLGGYHYRRLSTNSERYSDKPEKNASSHAHDALQYAATILFGGGLTEPRDDDDYPAPPRSMVGRSEITGY